LPTASRTCVLSVGAHSPHPPGTSGGNTSNDINNGTLNYPCALGLLSGHGITLKNYNFHCPSNYSILALFKKWATGGPNNGLNQPKAQFFSDCTDNTLPAPAAGLAQAGPGAVRPSISAAACPLVRDAP